MKRNASAVWTGDLKQGKGKLSTSSGVLKETPYSFTTRFGDANGTNPEELIAAAHAGCFTMATAAALGRAGFTPGRLATEATLTLRRMPGDGADMTLAIFTDTGRTRQQKTPGLAGRGFLVQRRGSGRGFVRDALLGQEFAEFASLEHLGHDVAAADEFALHV